MTSNYPSLFFHIAFQSNAARLVVTSHRNALFTSDLDHQSSDVPPISRTLLAVQMDDHSDIFRHRILEPILPGSHDHHAGFMCTSAS